MAYLMEVDVDLDYSAAASTQRWDYVKLADALQSEQTATPFRPPIEDAISNYPHEMGYNDIMDMLAAYPTMEGAWMDL
eukprot:7453090-Pyramimonas_sp.AAC.1